MIFTLNTIPKHLISNISALHFSLVLNPSCLRTIQHYREHSYTPKSQLWQPRTDFYFSTGQPKSPLTPSYFPPPPLLQSGAHFYFCLSIRPNGSWCTWTLSLLKLFFILFYFKGSSTSEMLHFILFFPKFILIIFLFHANLVFLLCRLTKQCHVMCQCHEKNNWFPKGTSPH